MSITGGPAFPRPMGHNGLAHHQEHESNDAQSGMQLRDYFAAHALALLADATIFASTGDASKAGGISAADGVARFCYGIADALLRERQK